MRHSVIRSTAVSRRRLMQVAMASVVAAPAVLTATRARAAYPDRAIRIIVPNSPGGPSDVIARHIAPALQEALGASVIVENIGGGGGNIGMGRVARSDPDGYTLLLSTSSFVVNPGLFANLPYDPIKDFVPIAELALSPNVFVVRSDFPGSTMKDFVALARQAPDKFNVSTPPVGTTPHLATELLKLREGLPGVAIVFHTGGGAAFQALLSGSVQCYNGALSTAHAHIAAGTVKALAVTGASRWHDLPSIPTMLDAGYRDFVFDNFTALSAPANTPADTVARLAKETISILQRPLVQEQLLKSGFIVSAQDGKSHSARIEREVPMYNKIIVEAGIKLPKGG